MLVLATTYVELILKDFFRCLFIEHPLRMNKYLSSEGKRKGTITLTEVINATSREDLLLSLAERSAPIAVGPSSVKLLKRSSKSVNWS
jgi:hypothetical protein